MFALIRKIGRIFRRGGRLRHAGSLSPHLHRDIGLLDGRPHRPKATADAARRWRDRAGPWGQK